MLYKDVDKESSIPLHQQIYLLIKDSIENGELTEGDRLDSESEFQQRFNVSRITVRRALSDLDHDGFIVRKKGVGTTVAPIKKERELDSFNSFSSRAISEGDIPGSIILKSERVVASIKVSQKLNVKAGSEVFLLKRLRLLNGKIIALHDSYVALSDKFEIKSNSFDENTSLYDFLESNGIELGSADELLETGLPSLEVSKSLYIETGTPIMFKERVTYTVSGEPIEYSENTYVGSRYKYHIHLTKVR